MCCAHNNMLRALNSIHQQAIHVTSATDIRDLLTYARHWCSWLEEHHEGEEKIFFPQLETETGVKGLMATNVAQHHAFLPGLERMERYVKETQPEQYDGHALRAIMDEFGPTLTEHLSDEIQTLLELEKFDAKKLREIYEAFDLGIRNKGDKVR